MSRAERARFAILPRLGLRPAAGEVVGRFLDEALPTEGARALDAGCGRVSALVPFRPRIGELVGVDIHEPAQPLPWLDRFIVADVCTDSAALPAGTFDVVLSSFTVEHFADPPAALRTIAGWLRPGGWLVVTTVNRGHPFVNAYLSLPRILAAPLQRLVKASAADAHRLVGACNTPAILSAALIEAGYVDREVATVGHLARAWGRRRLTYLAGLIGDLAAQPFAGRRSTIVARARKPA